MPKPSFSIKHFGKKTLKKFDFGICRFAYDERLELDKLSAIPLWLGRIAGGD